MKKQLKHAVIFDTCTIHRASYYTDLRLFLNRDAEPEMLIGAALTRSWYWYTRGNKCSDSWKSESYQLERSKIISTKDNGTKREEKSPRLEMCAHAHIHKIEKRMPASMRVNFRNERLQTELFASWRYASKLELVNDYCKPVW